MHFNLNQSLKQLDVDNAECKNVEQVVPINSKQIYDCKFSNAINENMKNFWYIEALDVEYLNFSLEYKEIVLSLKEINAKKSSNSEEKG